MTTPDKTDDTRKFESEIQEARDLVAFVKENRDKVALHKFIGLAARAYIDGMRTALECELRSLGRSTILKCRAIRK